MKVAFQMCSPTWLAGGDGLSVGYLQVLPLPGVPLVRLESNPARQSPREIYSVYSETPTNEELISMDPSQIALARTILGWAASFGAGHIVSSIATTHTPIATTFHRVTVPVGKFALGSLVGAHAKRHTEEQFDQAVETVKSLYKGYKNKQTSQ